MDVRQLNRRGRHRLASACGLTCVGIACAGLVAGCGGSAPTISAPHAKLSKAVAVSTVASRPQTTGGSASAGGTSGAPNGVASQSPRAIVAAAGRAMDSLKSVHVSAVGTQSGVPMAFDVNIKSGVGGSGVYSHGSARVRFVVTGSRVYLNGGAAFWKQAVKGNVGALLADKWLMMTNRSATSAFVQITSVPQIVRALLKPGARDTLAKTETTTVRGQPTVAVRDKQHGGKLYVATTGEPYIVQISNASHATRAVFAGFNQRLTVSAPAHALTVP